MKAVQAEYANVVFKKEGCFDLPGTIAQRQDGEEEIETVWELSDEDLERINRDRRVYLYIMGRAMPPVFLSTESEIVC